MEGKTLLNPEERDGFRREETHRGGGAGQKSEEEDPRETRGEGRQNEKTCEEGERRGGKQTGEKTQKEGERQEEDHCEEGSRPVHRKRSEEEDQRETRVEGRQNKKTYEEDERKLGTIGKRPRRGARCGKEPRDMSLHQSATLEVEFTRSAAEKQGESDLGSLDSAENSEQELDLLEQGTGLVSDSSDSQEAGSAGSYSNMLNSLTDLDCGQICDTQKIVKELIDSSGDRRANKWRRLLMEWKNSNLPVKATRKSDQDE
ncbi:hypothetical protein NDU88_002934 [Pleurodeles waltl]|uniref:Uncharacterized protein n=1 Tax=Pleurodeles waltl TaxID=8319 RepID=A0AAV7MSU2_PLEWA|nr:hypothetical protein NDU88_002934 [Pleurodeles waltl]